MIHLIAGLVVLVFGAWGIIAWWDDFGAVLRGLIPAWLVLVGMAAIAVGLQRTMHNAGHKQECWDDPSAEPSVRPSED